jgi:predicted aldo/keto reductase-like oxidoreductase
MKPIAWPYYGIPFTCFGPMEKQEGPYTPEQTSIRWILNSDEVSTVVPGMNDKKELAENFEAIERDEKIDEKLLNWYLEAAQGSRAKEKLERMLNDQSLDIRYFAKRALKAF